MLRSWELGRPCRLHQGCSKAGRGARRLSGYPERWCQEATPQVHCARRRVGFCSAKLDIGSSLPPTPHPAAASPGSSTCPALGLSVSFPGFSEMPAPPVSAGPLGAGGGEVRVWKPQTGDSLTDDTDARGGRRHRHSLGGKTGHLEAGWDYGLSAPSQCPLPKLPCPGRGSGRAAGPPGSDGLSQSRHALPS